jgi:predicted ATPase with chaperone activity
VNLGAGLPLFSIVGLPATAVKESKERATLTNSGFEFPAGRITVNLDRRVLESLREPPENRTVVTRGHACRRNIRRRFNSSPPWILVPATSVNLAASCRCTPAQVQAYRARICGPLCDRVDLFIEVPRLPVADTMRRWHPRRR